MKKLEISSGRIVLNLIMWGYAFIAIQMEKSSIPEPKKTLIEVGSGVVLILILYCGVKLKNFIDEAVM